MSQSSPQQTSSLLQHSMTTAGPTGKLLTRIEDEGRRHDRVQLVMTAIIVAAVIARMVEASLASKRNSQSPPTDTIIIRLQCCD